MSRRRGNSNALYFATAPSGGHPPLATGETVNSGVRLAALAAPNPVVSSQVTARRAQGAFALEDVGSQVRTGVDDPTGVFRILSPTVVAGVRFLIGRDEDMWLLVRRWEAPEGAFPSKRLVEFLSVQHMQRHIPHSVIQEHRQNSAVALAEEPAARPTPQRAAWDRQRLPGS